MRGVDFDGPGKRPGMNPEPRFAAAEYADRLARTRAAMEAAGVELLIVSDPSNMHWLTGYDGWSFYVHQAVIVPPSGNPIWWGRGMDAAGARPDRVLMVAAHAWDLRGAQAVGMRAAYIGRSVGDPPKDDDTFDAHFDGLEALTTALVTGR